MIPYPNERQNPYIIQYINAITIPMATATGIFSFAKDRIPVAAPVKAIMMQINHSLLSFPGEPALLYFQTSTCPV